MEDVEASIRDLSTDLYHALDGIAGTLSDKRGRYEECLELASIYRIVYSYVEKHVPGLCNKKLLELIVVRSTLLEEDADPVFEPETMHLYLRRSQFELLRETHRYELMRYFRSKAQQLLIWREKRGAPHEAIPDEWMTIVDVELVDRSKSLLLLKLFITVVDPPSFDWGPHECTAAARYVAGPRHCTQCSEDTARKCGKCGGRLACQHHKEFGSKMSDAELCRECE
jgi:hypothetical protein